MIDLDRMLDALREGLQIIGFDWCYLYLNQTAIDHAKKSTPELLGRTMMEVYPGIDETPLFKMLKRCMEGRIPLDMANEFRYADGNSTWFELRIRPCDEGIAILSTDITERMRMEMTLRQAQKMDAVGKLAGGVAHDFNNLITVISSYAEFIREALPDGSPLITDVEEISRAIGRASKLTRQLLAFSRQRAAKPEAIDIDAAMDELVPFLTRLIGADIALDVHSQNDKSIVLIDPNAFQQVVMNLAVNARDAMPQGGKLSLEIRNIELDICQSAARGNVIPAGPYVMIAVNDTGTGMSKEVQERLFEPFFTTKPEGQGTGLGLATSWGIVRQAGGFIWVYSEPQQGSTFKVYLPRALDGVVEAKSTAPAAAPTGTETVLVVEDDKQLLTLVRRCLEGGGYITLAATSSDEAINIADTYSHPIHLLFTDIVLPGSNGVSLAHRLALKLPDLRTLYSSGYTEQAAIERASLPPGSPLLEKPFTPDALLRAVRATLSSV